MAMLNPLWCLRTGRLRLMPVGQADLPDLIRLKADPRVFAPMWGGVRTAQQTMDDLAQDIVAWGRDRVGLWSARDESGAFGGLVGLHPRPDGRGMGLRFAFWPEWRGQGLAREAAGAALRYAHEQAGLQRVVAVARHDNFASRIVLGAIGMVEYERFDRDGFRMVGYESRKRLHS